MHPCEWRLVYYLPPPPRAELHLLPKSRCGGCAAVLATLRVSSVGIIMPSGVVDQAGCCELWT